MDLHVFPIFGCHENGLLQMSCWFSYCIVHLFFQIYTYLTEIFIFWIWSFLVSVYCKYLILPWAWLFTHFIVSLVEWKILILLYFNLSIFSFIVNASCVLFKKALLSWRSWKYSCVLSSGNFISIISPFSFRYVIYMVVTFIHGVMLGSSLFIPPSYPLTLHH